MRFTTTLAAVVAAAAILVPSALATRFTDESYFVPKGAVGAPYSHWFHGDGGCGPALPYQFRILGGSVPPGVSLSKEGHLSGTPTQAGTFSFWVELSDQNPPEASWCVPKQAEREFTVIVEGGGPTAPTLPPLAVTTPSLPVATAGTPYALALQASGGGAQAWSVASGSLPAGLALSAGGMLAGTPVGLGLVRVHGARHGQRPLGGAGIHARRPCAARRRGAGTHTGEVGLALTPIALSASGGSGSTSWRIEGALPAGRHLRRRQRRGSSGTPGAPGSFPLRAVATDAEGRTSTVELGIVVAPRLTIRTTGLVVGRVGARLSLVRPHRRRDRAVRLPRCVRPVCPLDSRSMPCAASSSAFPERRDDRVTIEARDTLGVISTRTFGITVRRRR